MPAQTDWSKRIGSEFYFRADEPVVIGANWGNSNVSYTGYGYSIGSSSCSFAVGFTPEANKDYDLVFKTVKGSAGKDVCTAEMSELRPGPENEGKIIGVRVPLQRIFLYGTDEAAAANCKQQPNIAVQ